MKKELLLVVCGAVLASWGCKSNRRDEGAPSSATLSGGEMIARRGGVDIERGKYLVAITGCNDCHTPKKNLPNGPEADTSRLLAGFTAGEKVSPAPKPMGDWIMASNGSLTAWSGPWGISYAANLTPDNETGLGGWTEEQFARAIRTGKHLGAPAGRPILLPMPWFDYAKMTDDDLRAVWAYLRSIPPVKNAVPSAVLAAPAP